MHFLNEHCFCQLCLTVLYEIVNDLKTGLIMVSATMEFFYAKSTVLLKFFFTLLS